MKQIRKNSFIRLRRRPRACPCLPADLSFEARRAKEEASAQAGMNATKCASADVTKWASPKADNPPKSSLRSPSFGGSAVAKKGVGGPWRRWVYLGTTGMPVGCSILILASVFILVSCSKKEEQKNNGPQVIPVKVSKVELRDLANIIEYVGNIKAEDEVAIYPKVSGKIIEKVKEDGARVNKGDAIAYIDRDEVGLKFEKAPVESTLTGIVGRVYVDIGTNVNTQTAIALVVSMDKVKIEVEIPEKYLSKISLGQSANVTVDAYPEEQFIGKITKISPVVDLTTRASPIEITVDNRQYKLQSGMFARVKLILQERKKSPVILKEAIVGKIPDVYVYTIENKKAQLKKITLGIRQGPYYEVQEGLKEGNLVVIMGQQRLREGAQVIVEEETIP